MAYQVLARKYRPTLFSDVVGQDHVTRTLLNALTQDRIAHGYIFSGHRGIGKTTIARILASALNCRNAIGSPERPTAEPCNVCESCTEIRIGNSVDVVEIDAATNRGIDEIRELRDAARYRPARDRFRIYILDEAHQITDAAFNALLKTLEEPPDHIVFMMATTQPEDIPQTIRSRCQHFSFHAVKLDDIVGQLRMISTKESIEADDATLSLLAEAGDGSMRDALSIMDQAIASAPTVDGKPELAIEQVRELMGSVSNAIYEDILEGVSENSSARVLTIAGRLLDAGNGPAQIARQFVRYLRNTLVAKISGLAPDGEATGASADLLQISPEERRRVSRSAALFSEEELSRFLAIMLRTFDDLGYRQEQRFHLELGLLKLVHAQRLIPVEEILSQMGAAVPSTTPRIAAASTRPSPSTSVPPSAAASTGDRVTPATPSRPPSPFEADRSRKITGERAEAPPVASTVSASTVAPTAGALALAEDPAPKPSATDRPHLVQPAQPAQPIPLHEPALAEVIALDVAALQTAAVEALAANVRLQSASVAADSAIWSVREGALEIQTDVSKAMLGVLFGSEAEKTMKLALAAHGAGSLRIQLLPGAAAAEVTTRPKRAPSAGSVGELAANHPLIQAAQDLFRAEITKVHDLRDKN